ncbi:hypothetical protein Q5P01_004438 [Channa striata]|uniref:Uncharacterized protein n=1 Tax=Channa striata TaxID=64152 RepID=A0AA88NHS0_CHASR|nr:hypothetical protein Q5P01_004438 [Channa striata]
MLWELADGRTDSWTDSDFSLCVCAAVMLFLPGWTSIKMSPLPLLLNRKEWLVSRFDPNKEREAKSEHDESEQEDEDGTKL